MITSKYLDTTGLGYLWDKIMAALEGRVPTTRKVNGKALNADITLSASDVGAVAKVTSTDNAVVRFNGTGGNVQNSGVTINDSNHVTAAKFITSGGTSGQVVKGDGSLSAANTLPQYEAYLEWGGKNFSASYGPIDAAMVSELGAPRTMYAKPAGIVVEYSTDNGATWHDYEATDEQKAALFSTGGGFVIGHATAATASADNLLRVSLRTSAAGIYTTLNKFVISISTNGSTGTYCTIRCRTQQNYEDNVDTWVIRADHVTISGWSGYNVINISSTTTYGNTKSQYGELQFIFGSTGHSGANYGGLNVLKILGFGGVGWGTPSNMAKTGHLYSFDVNQNAGFPANVTASSFIKSGGTSSQFLKADGSVDSNTYVKTSDFKTTKTSNIGIDAPGTNAIGYVSGLTKADWNYQQTDGSLYTQFYNNSWINEIFQDFRTGQLSVRGKNNNVWQPWRRILDETNASTILGLSAYAPLASPALTGTPTAPTAASGTNTTQIATTAFVKSAVDDKHVVYDLGDISDSSSWVDDTTLGEGGKKYIGSVTDVQIIADVTVEKEVKLKVSNSIYIYAGEVSFGHMFVMPLQNVSDLEVSAILVTEGYGIFYTKASYTESDPTVPSHVKSITTTDISNWNGKQAAISDLATIRSGAALGATALQSYTETDPVFTASAAHGITSSDISSWNGKQKAMALNTQGSTTSKSVDFDNYYRFTATVNTLAVTLPSTATLTDSNAHSIILEFTTGSSPNVTFSSANSATINYFDGFNIEASTEYEVNALWNGSKWILARTKVVSSRS